MVFPRLNSRPAFSGRVSGGLECLHMSSWSSWWYTYPSEKYEFVNWDEDIPNIWKNKPVMFQSPPTTDGYWISWIQNCMGSVQADLRTSSHFSRRTDTVYFNHLQPMFRASSTGYTTHDGKHLKSEMMTHRWGWDHLRNIFPYIVIIIYIQWLMVINGSWYPETIHGKVGLGRWCRQCSDDLRGTVRSDVSG